MAILLRFYCPFLSFFPDNTDAFLELERKNLENQEGDWALNILQHLLIKLAGDNKFVIESYPSPQSLPLDESKGQIGDTSFGKNCVLMARTQYKLTGH